MSRRRAGIGLAAALCLGTLLGACTGAGPAGPASSPTAGRVASDLAVPPVPAGAWLPRPGTAWQWQLTGELDLSVDVPVYELDGGTTTAAQVDALHTAGRHAVCYVSVGSWEDFRPDAAAFPRDLLGERLDGFPDERWLDVRRLDLLGPLLRARLDTCRDKGFDAVEADNVDGWANDSGFDLDPADGLALVRWVAAEAHARGLSVALKNDLEQVDDLVADVDFAVVEECARYDECEALRPFVRAGKAVLRVEYGTRVADCGPPWDGAPAMLKHEDLDAFRAVCPAG